MCVGLLMVLTAIYLAAVVQLQNSMGMQGIVIIPYPVKAEPAEDEPWWGGKEKTVRLLREYGKLLITYAREPGRRPKTKSVNDETSSQ